jgi:AcrR family transcriptional regulator
MARPTRDEVRTAIMAAAFDEFAERGYAAATVESIARRAGFTKGAVYGNFDGKFELLLELLGPQARDRARFRDGLGGPPGDPEASLARVARLLHATSQDLLPTLVVAEARGHAARSEERAAQFAQVRTRVVDAMAKGLAHELTRVGLEPLVPVREVVYTLLALINGISLDQVGVPEPVISVQTFEQVLRALVAPVTPGR